MSGAASATHQIVALGDGFYNAFPIARCEPSHLALEKRTITDLRGFVLVRPRAGAAS